MDRTAIDLDRLKTAPIPDVLSKLAANPESGLSLDEARHRLQQYGYNETSEKRISPLVKFLSYFWGPIPWMIEIAAVLCAAFITGRISGLFSFSWW